MTTFEEARAIAAARRPGIPIATWGWDVGDRWIVINDGEAADDTRMSVIKETGEYIEEYGIPGLDYPRYTEKTMVGTGP